MSVFFDILLVGLFLFIVIRYWRLGFVCSILSAGKLLFSLIVAAILCSPVASLLSLAFEESSLSSTVIGVISGILAFILLFVASFIGASFLIRLLSKVKIPLVSNVDKLIGLIVGLVIGILLVSAISTVLYSVLEIITFINPSSTALDIYYDSYVFRFVCDFSIFEFIRNLI